MFLCLCLTRFLQAIPCSAQRLPALSPCLAESPQRCPCCSALERNRLSGTLPPQLLLRGSLVDLRVSLLCTLCCASSVLRRCSGLRQLCAVLPPHADRCGPWPRCSLLPSPACPALRAPLQLSGNCFSGILPDAWVGGSVHTLELANNSLSGPAFPPAWLGAGALQHLITLDLSGNAGLAGTLPSNLSWPVLAEL